MRHNKKFNHLGRTASHRSAMLANMAVSLIMHKRITTTLAKAKELKKFVEPMITRAKVDNTNNRRVIFSQLHGIMAREEAVRHLSERNNVIKELFGPVAAKVGDRPGGYTRIIKTGIRKSDATPMCFIELVDFNENMVKEVAKKATRRSRRGGKKAEAAATEAPAVEEATVTEAPAEATAAE